MSAFRTLLLVTAACALCGCAGMSEQACQSSDWKTVGFEDGTQGRPVGTIGRYQQACSKHGVAPNLERYRAGYAEGVREYCRASRGFQVGQSGATYQGVCPPDMEPAFLAQYNSGHHLYELESAVRSVENRIASDRRAQVNIKKRLTTIGLTIADSKTAPKERVSLVAEVADLGRRYGELSKEIQTLQKQQAANELALDDYRATLSSGA